MAIQRQLRRGTKAENDAFTGAAGELVQDTDNDRIIAHDGSLQGGFAIPNHNDVMGQVFQAVDGVGTNTVTLTLPYAPSAYAEYQRFTFKPAANNTGAVTLNVNSLGAKDVKKDDGSGTLVALEADDLKTNIPVDVIYDGTQFILQLGGGASGTYVLLDETDASSTSSIDYSSSLIDGTYTRYEFHISRLLPASNGDTLYIRASVDGGSTYETVGQYVYYGTTFEQGGTSTDVTSVSTAGELTNGGVNSAGNGANGTVICYDPSNTTGGKFCESHLNYVVSSGGGAARMTDTNIAFNGIPFTTNDINGFQFYYGAGNIASGKIKLYGVT